MNDSIELIFSKTNYDINTLKPTQFILVVDIIDQCNYNCYYCYNNKPRTNKLLDLNQLYKFVQFLKLQYTNLIIQVAILGGEPTLHPNLISFLEKCYLLGNIKCVIFSNFSANISSYITYLKYDVKLNLSFHQNTTDYNNNFIKKLELIPHNYLLNNSVNVILLYDNKYWNDSIKLFKLIFSKYPNNITMPFLMDNLYFKCNYSKEMYQQYDNLIYLNQDYIYNRRNFELVVKYKHIIKNIIHEMYSDKRHLELKCFYHYLCDAGKYTLYVHNNGYVYPCEAYYDLNKYKCSIYNFNNIKLQQTLCECEICGCPENAKKIKVFNK